MEKELQKTSRIFGIVISSVMIVAAFCALFGQVTGLIRSGFIAFGINIVASPIVVLFQMFVDWTGMLACIYIVFALFLAVGIFGLIISIIANKCEKLRKWNFIFSAIVLFFDVLCIASISIFGLGVLTEAGIWSTVWLFMFILASATYFSLELTLLIKRVKQKKVASAEIKKLEEVNTKN